MENYNHNREQSELERTEIKREKDKSLAQIGMFFVYFILFSIIVAICIFVVRNT